MYLNNEVVGRIVLIEVLRAEQQLGCLSISDLQGKCWFRALG